MIRKTVCIGFAVAILTTLNAGAQGDEWRFSAGPSYRNFDGVDWKTTDLTPGASNFINGTVIDADNYTILGTPQLDPNGWEPFLVGMSTRNVSFDDVTLPSTSKDADEGIGVQFYLDRDITNDAGWEIGLGIFQTDCDDTVSGNDVLTTTTTSFLIGDDNLDDNDPEIPAGGLVVVDGEIVPGGLPALPITFPPQARGTSATTATTVNLESDLNLYVLSLGVNGNMVSDRFTVNFSGGPTLNIANFETDIGQTTVWTAPNDPLDGTVVSSTGDSDDELDLIIGLYGTVGIEFFFTERLGVSAEYRYDFLFDEVSTSHAEMDLGGYSGSLLFIYHFD